MLLIINTALPSSVHNTHSFFHVKFNLILQLIKGISNDLKKLLKYFNGTTTFTFILAILLATTGLPNKLILYFKEFYTLIYQPLNQQQHHLQVLHLVYIDKELLMNLDNYLNILLNYT